MGTVGIVDPGVGSIRSAELAFRRICREIASPPRVQVVTAPHEARACDALVLAPRGAFAPIAQALRRTELARVLAEHLAQQRPVFAIDLGMQLLFERCGPAPGLGLLLGEVRQLEPTIQLMTGLPARVPHVGWNRLLIERRDSRVIDALGRQGTWVSFDHATHVIPEDRGLIAATTEHGAGSIGAAISRGSLVGTQFRPERSQRAGIRMIVGFLGSLAG